MTEDRIPLYLLRKVKVFSQLDDSALCLIQAETRRAVFEAGDTLCEEGQPGDRLFIIGSGEVSVIKRSEDGVPVEVAKLITGDIAGELSLFGQVERSASLKASMKTECWVLDFGTFQQLLEHYNALSRALLTYLSQHIRRENSLVARALSQDSDPRFKVAIFDNKPYMERALRECNPFGYSLRFFEPRLSLDTVPLAAGFKVICVFVNDILNKAVLEELNSLSVEMIALRCAGYNNVDLKTCQNLGISVARVPAYSPHAVAEHALTLMMTLNRHIHRANARVREGNFSLNGLVGFDVYDKTVGIIGTGKIGKCMLSILAGFGCKLLVYSRTYYEEPAKKYGAKFVSLDELLAQSDIISIHAPLTPQTHHMINDAAIAKMKTGVMLINTSRGGLIDTRALLDALRSGKIGYAGLDVYEEESGYFFEDLSDRVVRDDVLARLTTFNNVIVTSHQAFLTEEALRGIAQTTFDNIREFQMGKRMMELTNAIRVTPGPND
jgi:D-lactate dehydrogenase